MIGAVKAQYLAAPSATLHVSELGTIETLVLVKIWRVYDLKNTLQKDNPLSHEKSFTKRFEVLSECSPLDPKPLARIKETLRRNISKYLTCLRFPSIPLTSNTAERSLRHLVIKRKISFGSASKKGAETLSVLLSVLLSLYRKDPISYFERYGEMRV